MEGYVYHDKPSHEHDCSKCRFLFSVENEKGKRIDVYEKCGDRGITPWLIRFSSDGPDYSTVNLNVLVISYALTHSSEWKKDEKS